MDEDKLENSENSLKSARSKPKTMAITEFSIIFFLIIQMAL